jgi:heparan-alpha-glucosaminide N-acetyltransferase
LFFSLNPPPSDFDYTNLDTDSTPEAEEVFTGRFAPWSKNSNVAHRLDMWLLPMLRTPQAEDAEAESPGMIRKILFSNPAAWTHNSGGYTTLNFWPSIATMLLGVVCGQLLIAPGSRWIKLGLLFSLGLSCLILGLAGNQWLCPIVKRIWTPSWALFSGAYAIWFLAAFYLLFDVLPFRRLAFPLVVVGTNSMLMYLLGQLFNGWTADRIVHIHLAGVLEVAFGPDVLNMDLWGRLTVPTVVFLMYWLLALWLYRQKIFLRV